MTWLLIPLFAMPIPLLFRGGFTLTTKYCPRTIIFFFKAIFWFLFICRRVKFILEKRYIWFTCIQHILFLSFQKECKSEDYWRYRDMTEKSDFR